MPSFFIPTPKMVTAPKYKGPICQVETHINESEDEQGYVQRCDYCYGHAQRPSNRLVNVTRWMTHFCAGCPQVPEEVKEALLASSRSTAVQKAARRLEFPVPPCVELSSAGSSLAGPYNDWCDDQRAEEIDRSILAFLDSIGEPEIISSPFFFDMVTEMNEAYAKVYFPRLVKRLQAQLDAEG